MRVKNKYRLFLLCFVAVMLIFTTVYAEEEPKVSDYIGSDACEKCHEQEYLGWKNTFHNTMVREANNDPRIILGDFTDPLAKKYKDKYKIEYVIGSHWQQRYLVKIKDDYFALPITWSIITKRWKELDISKKGRWKRKRFSYYKKCIGCHVTNYNPEDRSYSEHTIGCESCHGPGRKHVETEGDVFYIVNPFTLKDTRREMICAQCHVRATDKSKTYTFPIGYRPGDNLADFLSLDNYIKDEDETDEAVIIREFDKWKKLRESPKSCEVCGIEKPSAIPLHLIPKAEGSQEFCLSCHNFGDRINDHTQHKTPMSCDACHVRLNNGEDDISNRNIHSYDYYLIHKKGCYDHFIEKSCVKCHKDKLKDWATPYIIDWSTPAEFTVHED